MNAVVALDQNETAMNSHPANCNDSDDDDIVQFLGQHLFFVDFVVIVLSNVHADQLNW